jgi:hypothetical protein
LKITLEGGEGEGEVRALLRTNYTAVCFLRGRRVVYTYCFTGLRRKSAPLLLLLLRRDLVERE